MAQQAAPSTVATPVPDHDFMPLNGIHHVELYVGNALQSAYFYAHAFGFRRVAYRGLETARATRSPTSCSRAASAWSSRARCTPDSPIAAHQHRHGDGVRSSP